MGLYIDAAMGDKATVFLDLKLSLVVLLCRYDVSFMYSVGFRVSPLIQTIDLFLNLRSKTESPAACSL